MEEKMKQEQTETFNDVIDKIKFNSFGKVYIDELKVLHLRRLHSQEIKEKDEEIKRLKKILNKKDK